MSVYDTMWLACHAYALTNLYLPVEAYTSGYGLNNCVGYCQSLKLCLSKVSRLSILACKAVDMCQDSRFADWLTVIQAVHNGRCNGHTDNTSSFDLDNCQAYLTGWIILFGGIQLLLSQVKDFHSLW